MLPRGKEGWKEIHDKEEMKGGSLKKERKASC
jgi:hypothetical protein